MKRLLTFKQRPSAAVPPNKSDVALLAQLWADQFQHMTTLALAGGGGLLVLLQTGIVSADKTFWSRSCFSPSWRRSALSAKHQSSTMWERDPNAK